MSYLVRKAHAGDVKNVYELLMGMASFGLLLPRSYANIYEMLQTFYVAEASNGELLGVAALQVAWEDLAEVRSLAVRESSRHLGVGRALTQRVEKDARELKIHKMFALTFVPEFFLKLGYSIVGLDTLPQKIWAVCFNCVHYPNCKEIAVVKEFS
ncbi:MAG: N-acetyltransferase [Deltaproteobacteria bacterium]|jgi:amino-acid N-acetyltransferase|nr:N-acetyltransferase [Deltaproteobacteria bacterium]